MSADPQAIAPPNPPKKPRKGCLLLLLLVMLGVVTAAGLLVVKWQTAVSGSAPHLNPVERLYLSDYLTKHADGLTSASGTGDGDVDFVVFPGETAVSIAENLRQEGVLNDTELFSNYLRYYGLDSQIEAGNFSLNPAMSIPQLAIALTDSDEQYAITLNFLAGWRVEEMARYLAATTPGSIDADTFLAIAQRKAAFDLAPYDFLASLPADGTLEGYLFPDTYVIDAETTAAELVDLMLQNFGRQADPAMRQAFGAQGLSLREAVTLASIVGREGVVAEERPLIAGVFYNRLADGIPLQADPTAQYAQGYDAATDSWWKMPITLDDLQYDSPYNTYVAPALPPAPIMSPDLAALQAVAHPEQTTAYFFVANCDPARLGWHLFSVTYDEHLAKVEGCRNNE